MEQLPGFNTKNIPNVFKPGNGWRINATLHKSNKINRIIRSFRELFLSELRFAAEVRNIPAKQSIEVGHAASLKELERSLH